MSEIEPTDIEIDRFLARMPAFWKGPGRDPARIDRVLAALRAAWTAAPDQRLGQLLANALPPERRPRHNGTPADDERVHAETAQALYFLEDDEWERALAGFGARAPEPAPKAERNDADA
jgi:hypothetical protein